MKIFLKKLVNQDKVKLIEPSENICESYLRKSQSNIESSKILLNNDKLEESISLIYYGMYNLVLAILYKIGIKSENHEGSIYPLKEIFNIDNSSILQAKTERIDKQYYVGFKISKLEVEEILEISEEFNRDLKSFIFGLGKKDIGIYRVKFKELLK